MKHITIVTPCYNEEANVEELYRQARDVMAQIPDIRYEHLFIDNCSLDRTPELLRKLAAADPAVKVIFNARNFGHIRSPYHGLMQAPGDAAILLVADLQDPPELIKEFIARWREGAKLVVGVKPTADESGAMFAIRRLYYRTVTKIADVRLIQNFTGFGLYDRQVLDELRRIDDPYPYLRGLVSEVGFDAVQVPYNQPRRKRGISKNNFYTLYDIAMLGITSHSRVPLRVATICGFLLSGLSLLLSIFYLLVKLIFWNNFSAGAAPMLIGMFFFASVQLFFIGLLGEYVGAILTHVMKRPLVVERERLNWPERVTATSPDPGQTTGR
ncbi:glycosyltransferase family 2 protein [Xylophilus sp. GOD-11R]|uniref:glycosyltransferase family 2 protein n=1 Tax=Xylophilus sp. GOD-11R TaxID=3089814 RepID=UPI00298C0C02|nr:glycosyltransferase family 2 protein [Xylophilus sp. GOD-11R]WPB57805.1 glycosyltransferase family 2 protein [Xylophilus sp. GOD-11R]